MNDPLGLSIGTTNLVAVRNGSPPVTRRPVLTLFAHRAPEVGVPTENPNLAETGTLITGFVERIGGANTLVSADGSTHDPALILVEALDAMISAAGGDASASQITIAVPAHWGPEAVRALHDAVQTHAGFVRRGIAPTLISDAVTALTALNSEARLPADGMVALLDFGGGGTSITLADAGSGFRPIGETLRYPEFSGDQIDEALLLHVLDSIGHTGDVDPESTAAVGQFVQLREDCRNAKERLSTNTVTELVADLPVRRSAIQVSRAELESLIEDRLSGALSAFDDVLARNKLSRENLAAVAMVGGGASIPRVAQRLSSHTRASVVTAVRPALAMAVGAVIFASREPAQEEQEQVEAPTAMAAAAGATTGILGLPVGNGPVDGDRSSTLGELAWSQADDTGDEPLLYTGEPYGDDDGGAPPSQYQPAAEQRLRPRYRLPQLLLGLAALIAMIAIGGVAYTLTSTTGHRAPPAPTSSAAVSPPLVNSPPPSVSPVPPPPSPAAAPSVAPPPPTSAAQPPPPPPPVTTTSQPPPTTTRQPTTTTTTTTTPSTITTTTPPPTTTTTTATAAMTTEYLTLPLVPVPIPVQVPQNQAPAPQNPFLNPGGG